MNNEYNVTKYFKAVNDSDSFNKRGAFAYRGSIYVLRPFGLIIMRFSKYGG